MTQFEEEQVGLLSSRPRKQRRYVESAPLLIRYRSSKWFILGTICLALFTDSFIYGVLVPVLPFMLRDRCHISDGTEQLWTSALFALFGAAILIGSPICGWCADQTAARRLPLLFSLPILAGATVLLGASKEVSVLLISRFLQGLSTAAVWTIGLALVRDTVGKDEVGQCMGTAISASSVGLVVSPMLGGTVYFRGGLWGVIGMMIGLVCLNIVLVVLMIEKRIAKKYRAEITSPQPHDVAYGTMENHSEEQSPPQPDEMSEDANAGQDVCKVNGHFPNSDETDTPKPNDHRTPTRDADVEYGTIQETCYTADSHRGLKGLFRAPKGGWLYALPVLRLLRSPRILTDAYGVFTQFGLLASFDAFLPLFVKRRFNWGSLGAGLIFLNIALPALLGPLAGKLSDRFGPRKVAFAGCVLTAPPLVLLRLIGYDSIEQIVLLCALLILIGFFLTLIISPLAADMSFAVDQIELDQPGAFGDTGAYAQAYAFFNVSMAAACVVGPVVAGAIQDRYGAPTVGWVLALWVASAAVPVLFFTGQDVRGASERSDEDEDDD